MRYVGRVDLVVAGVWLGLVSVIALVVSLGLAGPALAQDKREDDAVKRAWSACSEQELILQRATLFRQEGDVFVVAEYREKSLGISFASKSDAKLDRFVLVGQDGLVILEEAAHRAR